MTNTVHLITMPFQFFTVPIPDDGTAEETDRSSRSGLADADRTKFIDTARSWSRQRTVRAVLFFGREDHGVEDASRPPTARPTRNRLLPLLSPVRRHKL